MSDTEWHSVTMTTPNAPARLTLQLFLPRPKAEVKPEVKPEIKPAPLP
ncbi:hypothetical protein [Roseateles sp.]